MMHKLLHLVKDNLGLKVLSLVIAFFIWLLVSNTSNPYQTRLYSNVPITIVNQDSIADIGKVVEAQGSGTVTLRVQGRRAILQSLTRNDFYVEADMENINQMDAVPLTVVCNNSQISWDDIEMNPPSLKVKLENKVEQTFVAAVTYSGSPAKGVEVGRSEVVEDKNIVIAGPQSLMKILNQVTAPVNVAGMAEDATLSSTLKVYDKNGAELTETQMSSLEFKDQDGTVITDHKVSVFVDLWKVVTDIPLTVETTGAPASGYRVSSVTTIPVSISVKGTDEALASLGSSFDLPTPVDVTGADSNVEQEIDLTETMAGIDGLSLIQDADPVIQVTVKIERDEDITLNEPVGAIDLINRPENMDLVFTPADILPLSVHARTQDADPITAEDVSLSVDLSSCAEEGSYELPLKVELPEDYELSAPVTIKVSSKKKVEPQSELDNSRAAGD